MTTCGSNLTGHGVERDKKVCTAHNQAQRKTGRASSLLTEMQQTGLSTLMMMAGGKERLDNQRRRRCAVDIDGGEQNPACDLLSQVAFRAETQIWALRRPASIIYLFAHTIRY